MAPDPPPRAISSANAQTTSASAQRGSVIGQLPIHSPRSHGAIRSHSRPTVQGGDGEGQQQRGLPGSPWGGKALHRGSDGYWRGEVLQARCRAAGPKRRQIKHRPVESVTASGPGTAGWAQRETEIATVKGGRRYLVNYWLYSEHGSIIYTPSLGKGRKE